MAAPLLTAVTTATQTPLAGQSALAARVQPSPVTKTSGTVPPSNPSQNIPPSPNFLSSCSGSQYDNSSGCANAVLQAIANARTYEGLGPMSVPASWYSLSPSEQLFVATNLERVDRGLPALSGMATALDGSATQGAQQSQDPQPPAGFPWSSWGSNWAGAVGSPLEAIYFWMYDDGQGSGNIDCTQSNTSGCWGHRDNVLMALQCGPCLMGTGFDANGYQGYPSWAEILVDTSGSPQLDFSWSQVVGGGGAGPAPQIATGVGSTTAPGVIEQPNGAPSMFVQGPGNSLLNYWYIPSSGGWGAATVAGPGSAFSSPSVVAQADGAPSVFVEGPGNSLINYWYIPSSGGWGAATVAGPGSVLTVPGVIEQADGAPSVFVEGPGNSLLNYWYIPSSGGWGAATVAGSGSVLSVPNIVEQSDGAPSVFVEGPGNSLLNFWYIPSTGSWGAATVAGSGTAFSSPGVIEQANGAPSVFVEGPGNSLLNFWYIPSTGSWGAATVAGSGTAFSSPGVVEQANGAPSVFTSHPELNFWYIPSSGAWGSGTVNAT